MMRLLGWGGCFLWLCACGASDDGGRVPPGGTTGAAAQTTMGPSRPSGTAGGGGGGTSGGSSAGGVGDGGSCEKFTVKTDRVSPDMLIVMDASGSMAINGRWAPSVNAVNTVVGQLEEALKFGLMTFPGGGGIGCGMGIIDVPMALLNSQPIAGVLGGLMPVAGMTPTSTTLRQARGVLAARPPTMSGGLEGVPLPQYIMLVTDGDPNCIDVQDQISSLSGTGDAAAQQASIDEITNLSGDNVLTYVIGYDTASSSFAGVLDQMAAAGGTGDTTHRSVQSGAQLIEEFRKITSGLVSCSFSLAMEVDFQHVLVTLDGQPAVYGEQWVIQPDGHTVELVGSGCDALQGGAVVEAEVVCEVVQVI